MAGVLVHTFPTETVIHPDMEFPIQKRGGGRGPAGVGVRADLLAPWIIERMQVGNVQVQSTTTTYTFSIPAGKWMVGMAIQSNSAQQFKMGETVNGSEFIDGSSPANTVTSFQALVYGGTSGKSIFLSNLTGVCTLNFLLV